MLGRAMAAVAASRALVVQNPCCCVQCSLAAAWLQALLLQNETAAPTALKTLVYATRMSTRAVDSRDKATSISSLIVRVTPHDANPSSDAFFSSDALRDARERTSAARRGSTKACLSSAAAHRIYA